MSVYRDEAVKDTRTRRDKLRAMSEQTSSPNEAEIAKRLLAEMPAPKTLTRDQIFAAPDLRVHVGTRRVWVQELRVMVLVDADDPAYASDDDWDGT